MYESQFQQIDPSDWFCGPGSCIFHTTEHGCSHLHAECEDGNDDLEDERQRELPEGVVDAGPGGSVRDVVHGPGRVGVVDVVAELRGLERAAVVEQLWDQLAGAAPRVGIGEGQHGRDPRHHDHLQHRVLAQPCGLAPPAPGDVAADEERPPETPEHTQQNERHQLGHVPRRVILHVEQNQPIVAKRVDGAQRERRHKRREERPP